MKWLLSIVLTFISLLSSGHHQKNSHQQLHKEYTRFSNAEEKANFIVKKPLISMIISCYILFTMTWNLTL